MQETTQTIKVSSLYELPASVTNPTKKIVDQYAEIAATRPKELPVIVAGKVNGKHYLITHDEVYHACKQAGLDEVQVSIIEYEKLTDAVIQHVRKNKDPSTFEPLLVRDAVDFLGEHGIDENKAIHLFLLNNTITEKILRLPLDEKAIMKLRKLNNLLSERLTSVLMPAYIPAKIAKIDSSKQSSAVDGIEALVKMETISDAKFAWPNPDVIDVTLSEFTKKIKKDEKPKIATFTDEVAKVSEKNPKKAIIKHTTRTLREATDIAKTFQNILYIAGDRNHRSMIVDLKTHRVAEIKNKNKVQTIVDDLGSQAFVFPDLAARHLDLGNDEKVFMKKFSNLGEIQTILNNAKKKKIRTRGVLFTKERL